ncbi:hypothetical protein BC831DRAFT_69701 [Entophlyctis helioformis]|nr:hypothetical protein BC831DRAFT_69701 [Entophlyctis helioformis]
MATSFAAGEPASPSPTTAHSPSFAEPMPAPSTAASGPTQHLMAASGPPGPLTAAFSDPRCVQRCSRRNIPPATRFTMQPAGSVSARHSLTTLACLPASVLLVCACSSALGRPAPLFSPLWAATRCRDPYWLPTSGRPTVPPAPPARHGRVRFRAFACRRSVCPSVCPSLCPSVCPSVCRFLVLDCFHHTINVLVCWLCVSVCLCLCVGMPVCRSGSLICLAAWLSACLAGLSGSSVWIRCARTGTPAHCHDPTRALCVACGSASSVALVANRIPSTRLHASGLLLLACRPAAPAAPAAHAVLACCSAMTHHDPT